VSLQRKPASSLRASEASFTGVRIPMSSLSSSRILRSDGTGDLATRGGAVVHDWVTPNTAGKPSDGCRRRIGKKRSRCSNNMVGSQARSKLSNSTPTSSCRRAMNSFRRKRDLTRPEGETPLTDADVLATSRTVRPCYQYRNGSRGRGNLDPSRPTGWYSNRGNRDRGVTDDGR